VSPWAQAAAAAAVADKSAAVKAGAAEKQATAAAAQEVKAGGLLRTSGRPNMNRRTESARLRLYKDFTLNVSHALISN